VADFHKAGLLVIRDGRILLCRKNRGKQLLILPGGKFEPGETAMDCLTREIREELGDVSVRGAVHIGTYEHAAADHGKTVRIELYRGELAGEPAACSEIAELVWFDPASGLTQVSPSLREVILPDLARRGILAR
jgi:8-oxo-dGTP pyrophosphatase MutT (NUDIX family)